MKSNHYTQISNHEFKQYLIKNKDNQEAFYAYLVRKQKQPKDIMIGVD
ncbi:DUF6887 family protein [Crocosphaera chwakensis]|uniref:Uncharacterized protein n=1 Tax=Crocosphaera chwakensis CCY0110 TaxID=391612 RepID=A3INM7_9CHRO|nr:hypothetical protein [Crocosphaera chwakensis]EAZ91925.1 hypothetical protein CY0110_29659 [Crocosphaera chwakensis CCY0110]